MASQMGLRIGARIRQRRLELGMTQKQVARAMNEAAAGEDEQSAADAQRVSDWERGYNKPSERYLRQLVAALQVPDLTYFFEEPEQPDVLEALTPPATDQLGRIEETVNDLREAVDDLVLRLVTAGLLAAAEPESEKRPRRAHSARPKRAA